jgi:hypothetical protein
MGPSGHVPERTDAVPNYQGHHRSFLEEYPIFVHTCFSAVTNGRTVGIEQEDLLTGLQRQKKSQWRDVHWLTRAKGFVQPLLWEQLVVLATHTFLSVSVAQRCFSDPHL